MLDGHKVSFLTDQENECLACLSKAQKLFDAICVEDMQVSTDSYNFGHYIDAARNSVIMRGARRMDPDTLIPKQTRSPSIMHAALEGKVPLRDNKAGGTHG